MVVNFGRVKNTCRAFDGWLDKNKFFIDIISSSELTIDMKIVGSTVESREAFEMLRGVSLGKSAALVEFKIEEVSEKLYFGFDVQGRSFLLGEVPNEMNLLMTSSKKAFSIIQNATVVDSYSLGMSLVGLEVDRSRVMESAEDERFDDMSEEEFSCLLDLMRDTLDKEAYVTKIRFQVDLSAAGGSKFLFNGRQS